MSNVERTVPVIGPVLETPVENVVKKRGLYDPKYEHDACGVGFLANIDGRQSHDIVERAIEVLRKLLHRGASSADDQTGDGAGLLLQIPHELFQREADGIGLDLPPVGHYGIGVIFLPSDTGIQETCKSIVEGTIEEEDLSFLGWREVPVNPEMLGHKARASMPLILHCFIGANGMAPDALERKLYVARRQIELRTEEALESTDKFYVVSMSSATLIYKGMLTGGQIAEFYADLRDDTFVSAIAILHERYSTNTFPSWKLAQPFRYLAHNGEINTLSGNLNQMRSRENSLASPLFGSDIKKLLPIIDESGSDSSCLDNALELLVASGRHLSHAMLMLIPQAWGSKYPIGPDLRGFFEYHAGLMEPWDGPAAVAFSNGTQVGALLDRNGLRPARYTITNDNFMVLASEAGVLDFKPEEIKEKGVLRPGEMILADLEEKRVIKDSEIKMHHAHKQPYRRWVEENKIVLHGLFNDISPVALQPGGLFYRHKLFGYSREDVDMIVLAMATEGHEPIGSMGFDSPLAVLSERPQLLYNYFKQLFAQVTNPPIDPIREELVMSLMTFMGNAPNVLVDDPRNARLIKLPHPILSNEDVERIKLLNLRDFSTKVIQMGYPGNGGEHAFQEALDNLCSSAEAAATDRRSLIVLSDKDLPPHVAPIPALLAVSAVNQRLISKGIRTTTSIIVETGEAREVQHMALLLGYGATAVNPYLAFETIAELVSRNVMEDDIDVTRALENYISALCKGLMKVMSKMGISTLRSYRSAQVFEAIGLKSSVVERYFTGTPTRIEGIGLSGIYTEADSRFKQAHNDAPDAPRVLTSGGYYRYRKDGERHLWTPESITSLQQATRRDDETLYRKYAQLINDQSEKQSTLRGLLKFKKSKPVPISEVEPVEDIMKRFVTSAMSFGSISREAHETLAIAMNRIGGMSNSGEGGEDPERYKPLPNGDSKCSAVKQVASGRFGVTIEYLVNAKELQIKIAQGAKPGEGGQLPGHKVNEEIARVRHATPGVTLISPPPHHDIYSIEDIKQLIFDLKNANPDARVSVKLVSQAGIGTVAAGVAKGHADMVLISGYDGGTGASPLSSMKYAGVPWELGLAETHQTLVLNNLRSRIRVQADGQMKTGRDIAIAALLGAEEFGFATAPLVICGCVMMRKCQENTCPVGVATQDPELRRRYTGKPEYIVNFCRMLAQEVREHMAELGFKTIDEMIGRCDMLEMDEAITFWKARGLDYSGILTFAGHNRDVAVRCAESQEHGISNVLDRALLERASATLENNTPVEIELPIHNTDRATGTMLSGEIARRYGLAGLPDNSIQCRFAGSAGQSFGAFAAHGLTMILEGEANDYVGKGLSGARIIIKPPAGSAFDAGENTICGNVTAYGATSGEMYIHGKAGERFCIRNSGVNAVVEGVGDHGCEYMTGGRVVVLGATGVNFAAGMSGGIAYVFDPDNAFDGRCNLDIVDLEIVADDEDKLELRGLIEDHFKYTGSERARDILDNWEASITRFVKVFPMEYRRVLGQMSEEDEAVRRSEVVSA